MRCLKNLFDYECNQRSPVQIDWYQVKNYADDGTEVISFEKVDYPSIVKRHGTCDLWSLGALVRAGVDPKFPIRTSFCTGLELDSVVNRFAEDVASALVEPSNE